MSDRISSRLRRLETLQRRRAEIETAIAQTVAMARARGASWSAVGSALGVSAQAAQQRYGSLASSPQKHHQRHPASRPVRQDRLMKPRPQATAGRTRTRREN
jgi:hypothetical protein